MRKRMKMGLRAERSKVVALRNLWVDGDSTVKTVYGRQEGAETENVRAALISSLVGVMAGCWISLANKVKRIKNKPY